ncbi:alpha/beta hydrolase, partial [Azospirillum sp. B4]|uniref:alpha/beta hydrolase n=1 Tax=Azospirillum sp. B4 TaxID=95605 RepID=UPI0005C99B2A
PGEDKLRLSTYVDDMVAWARFLARQPKVRCVMLLGHSEGATIATLAATALVKASVPVCGVLSLSGVGRPFDQVLLDQVRAKGAPAEVVDKLVAIQAELRAGRLVNDVPPALRAMYRPSVQPYLMSMNDADPAQAAAALTVPLLVLQGETDLQVTVDDAHLLAQAQPKATLALIPGANHMLKTAPMDRAANIATYADPTLPLAPGVMEAITRFVDQATPRK